MMTTKPKTRKASAKPAPRKNGAIEAPAGIRDPTFALIDAHKALVKEGCRVYDKFDKAEFEARKTHGKRPCPMVAWRGHSLLSEYGIDNCREVLLRQPGADRKQVEKEYMDAKASLAAAERAGVEWEQHAGIAPLRAQCEHASAAERRAAMRMARTKPTTPAGAAALIAYTRRDIMEGEVDWQMVALKTAASALTRMGQEAA
ncbi:MAG: hypothetical protein M3178_17170 [Pseudomonadota bacterium]|nr:hypothetical protein [Pseudomonadota bacterium]